MRALSFSRTYGVEIECHAPPGLSHPQAAALLSNAGVPCIFHPYHAAHGVHPDTWQVTTDGSLGSYATGMEFKSPPLKGEEGFANLATVCSTLRNRGFTINKSCGLHVHVDVRRPTALNLDALKRLAMLYIENEALIDSCLPESRRGNNSAYCKSVANVSLAAINNATDVHSIMALMAGQRNTDTDMRRRRRYSQGSTKFVKLNFTPIFAFGTVEFRHHAGSVEAHKISNWVLACLRMVELAELSNSAVVTRNTQRIIDTVRRGTKRAIMYDLLTRPEGCTLAEVLEATGWRQASIAGVGHQYGLEIRQERQRIPGSYPAKYIARYWGTRPERPPVAAAAETPISDIPPIARASNLDAFAEMLGMSASEKSYWLERAALFAAPSTAADMMIPTEA